MGVNIDKPRGNDPSGGVDNLGLWRDILWRAVTDRGDPPFDNADPCLFAIGLSRISTEQSATRDDHVGKLSHETNGAETCARLLIGGP